MMNSKLLMISTSLFMGICGILLEFMPHEILSFFGASPTGAAPLIGQMAGALYLGWAMMNWMAKTVLIGGIYARPLAVGNFAHFLIGALALFKFALTGTASPLVWLLAIIYSVFAVCFAAVAFTHPLRTNEPAGN